MTLTMIAANSHTRFLEWHCFLQASVVLIFFYEINMIQGPNIFLKIL